MLRIRFIFSLFFLSAFVAHGFGQTCEPPKIVFNSKAENIFTPEQEMMLGDVIFERAESDYQVIRDARINTYLQSIGDRISKHLPDIGLRYQFSVVDMPITNAFSMAGGRIMISRKMISFVKSEDELAGVIGHELGHSVVRHSSRDISRYFKEILGVTSVSNRNDIFEKYNRFLDSRATKTVRISKNHRNNDQIEADRIGIYAAYAAGYDANAFASFWERFTEAENKNFFSRMFGTVRPEDTRLKEIIAALKDIPLECRDTPKRDQNEKFEEWRTALANFSGLGEKELISGLIYKRRLVPLRGDIDHLRFSPNGEYILAQDRSSVTVLTRDPMAVLFSVEANDSFAAHFSRDSKKLIVSDISDRVREWGIPSGKLIRARGVASAARVWFSQISPDGKYSVVYTMNGDLTVFDTASGEVVVKESEFYKPSDFEAYSWSWSRRTDLDNEAPVLNLRFSPSGRYLLVGRAAVVGMRYSSLSRIAARTMFDIFSTRATIAFDLESRTTISVGGSIKKLIYFGGDFINDNEMVGKVSGNISESGVFKFPSGDRVSKFELSGESFLAAEEGRYVTVRPVANAPVAIFDLSQKKYIIANKKAALDVYGGTFVAERKTGEVAVYDMKTNKPIAAIELPPSPLARLRSFAIADNGDWLALSERSRGAAWNLHNGNPVLHVRSFRGSYISPDDKLYADFPEEDKTERSLVALDLRTREVQRIPLDLSKGNNHQYGNIVITRTSEQTEKKPEDDDEPRAFTDPRDPTVGSDDATFWIKDSLSGATLWKREFRGRPPAFFVNYPESTMIFCWYTNHKEAKKIMDRDPKIKKANSSDDNVLIEIVDMKSGAVRSHFLLDTGEGSIFVDHIYTAGDYLTVTDTSNRSQVYSVSTGKLIRRFFGERSDIAAAQQLIAVENPAGNIRVWNIVNGSMKGQLSFTKPIAAFQFLDDGKRLFVLTSDQVTYMFDTAKLGEPN